MGGATTLHRSDTNGNRRMTARRVRQGGTRAGAPGAWPKEKTRTQAKRQTDAISCRNCESAFSFRLRAVWSRNGLRANHAQSYGCGWNDYASKKRHKVLSCLASELHRRFLISNLLAKVAEGLDKSSACDFLPFTYSFLWKYRIRLFLQPQSPISTFLRCHTRNFQTSFRP